MQLTISVKLKGTFCLWSLAAVLLMALLYLSIKETLAKDSMHCICGRACSLGLRQRTPRYFRPPGTSRQAAATARSLSSAAAVHKALAPNSTAMASAVLQRLRYQSSQDAQLEATIAAVAGGPQRDQIFLTMVNKAAAQHHLPWFLKSLRSMQVPKTAGPLVKQCIADHLLVVTWDLEAHLLCQRLHHPLLCFQDLAKSENASEPISHFSSGYFEAGWRRAAVVRKAVDWGYNVLVTDVDLVWFSSPYIYTDRFPEADVLVSNDCHASRWRLPGNLTEGSGPNLGFSYLRSNPRTKALMAKWLDCRHQEHAWDQACFRTTVHQAMELDAALQVHVTDDNAFPSLCCHYCELSTTTYDDRWSHAALNRCPWKQMRQWHYFHMACMKSMPDLLARKGGKMQQLMDFYAQRRVHEQFKGSV